jgi:GNAT superfamily N-acetyltransferase
VYGPVYNRSLFEPPSTGSLTGLPVDDMTDAQLEALIAQPKVSRALQLDSITRRRMAEDAEEAAILRGEIPLMLAAEGRVDTMVRMMRPAETRTPEAIMAQLNRGPAASVKNALQREVDRTYLGTLVALATGKAITGRRALTGPTETFVEAFKSGAQKDLGIPTPIDLLYALGAGVGAVADVYIAGGYNTDTAARLRAEAGPELEAAFKALSISRATTPNSRPAEAFLLDFTSASKDKGPVDGIIALSEAIVKNPLGFLLASTETAIEQVPIMGASVGASLLLGPAAGVTVNTLGSYIQELVNVDPDRIGQVKKISGVDLNTVKGRADFLSNTKAQEVFIRYGRSRAAMIAAGNLAGFGYLKAGTFVPYRSLTARLVEKTAVTALLEGLGDASASSAATGRVNWSDAILEGALGANVGKVIIDSVIVGNMDLARRSQSRKAEAWLKGSKEIKGDIAGIPVVKLDTAASVMGEKLESEGIESIHISAGPLLEQGGDVVNTLGLDPAEVARMAAEGGTVEVSASTFVRHILGKDGFDKLIEHTMFDPNGMTPAEAREYTEAGIGDQIQQQIEARVRANLAPGLDDASLTKLNTDVTTIQDQVAGQLEATGKYDANKSRMFGLLTAQRYAARAIRITEETGQPVDAAALFEADNLQIVGGQPTPVAFKQGGFEAYRKIVDPAGRTIPAEDRPNLRMGDMYGMLPKDAEVVGELDDVVLHRGANGDYYATAYNADLGEQDVVGYIQGRENGTELAVVEEMQGKGIGSELQYLFRRENPLAPTGGLTAAGASRLESTYNRLAAEYMDPLEQVAKEFGVSKEVLKAELDAVGGDITQTPRFKEWFGDSKVVDADGNPLVVYHGTTFGIEKFLTPAFFAENADEASAYGSIAEALQAEQTRNSAAARLGAPEPGLAGTQVPYAGTIGDALEMAGEKPGVWATDNGVIRIAEDGTWTYVPDIVVGYEAGLSPDGRLISLEAGDGTAEFTARVQDTEEFIGENLDETSGGNVLPVYLNIRNPLELPPMEANRLGARLGLMSPEEIRAQVKEWQAQGYDGIKTSSDEAALMGESEADFGQWIAFDPNQIKSATGNRGAFDPASDNILYQDDLDGALEQARATVQDPEALGLTAEEAARVNPIYRASALPTKRLASNEKAAKWLEEQFEGDAITDFTATLSTEQLNQLGRMMAAEVQLALQSTGNAADWYSGAVLKAITTASIKYPMLQDDAAAADAGFGTSSNARFAFTYIMAVTSQNLDVSKNSTAADAAFSEMVEMVKAGDYSMKGEWGTGDKQKAMAKNFKKFKPMLDAMQGDTPQEKLTNLDELFREKKTVKEWVVYMKAAGIPYSPPGNTAMDVVVYGSSTLGPKIGNGFWQNLNGNFDPLTIDLWMRRTWGRLTGKSIGLPSAIPAQRRRLKAAVAKSRSNEQGSPDIIDIARAELDTALAAQASHKAQAKTTNQTKKDFDAETRRLNKAVRDGEALLSDLAGLKAPEAWKAEYGKNDDALLAYSKRLLKAWNAEYKSLQKKYDKGSIPDELQPTWARAAKAIRANLSTPLDQITNGTQRKQVEAAGARAIEILSERGIDVTTADMQALLWYPEKELWGALRDKLEVDDNGVPIVTASDLNESYDTAFARIFRSQGYEVEGIEGDGAGGSGQRAVAGQDARLVEPGDIRGAGQAGGAVESRELFQQDESGDAGKSPSASPARPVATEGGGPGRDIRAGAVGRGELGAGQEGVPAAPLQPLPGAPKLAGEQFGPVPDLVSAAESYAEKAGIRYTRQPVYVPITPSRSERIAQAYEAAEHEPENPDVRRAYRALITQTKAQYDALIEAGYTFTFFDDTADPYDGNPWNAMRDLRDNKTMAVYSTLAGYGTDQTFDPSEHMLLEDTGLTWKDQNGNDVKVLANDLFRAVHDAFGHGLEGAGFRARGEENAWQAHARLFTGEAVKALTTETRGQNSWLNYGPYGEQNRAAGLEDTVFANQKMTILPSWVSSEGAVGRYGLPVNEDGTVTLTHFSETEGLTQLDPSRHGTGMAGDEGARKNIEGWVDRTYFGVSVGKEGGYVSEFPADTPSYEARVPADSIYDYQQDPDGLMATVKDQAITQRRANGDHLYDFGKLNTLYEKAIADAGYEGYFNNAMQGLTVAKFTQTEVTSAEAAVLEQQRGATAAPRGGLPPQT